MNTNTTQVIMTDDEAYKFKLFMQYYNIFENINAYMPEKELKAYWQKLCITGGGKKLNGLITRRLKESELFFKL